MPGRIKVVFESLDESAVKFLESADALEENLSELDTLVATLATTWDGDAHNQFSESFSQWRSASRDLHQAIRRLHQVTLTAHNNYSAAEAANLSMWNVA